MRENKGNHDVPVFGRSINLVKFYMKNIWTETETADAEDSWYDSDIHVDFTTKRTTFVNRKVVYPKTIESNRN